MCRILGCVSAEPISIEHELLHAENPLRAGMPREEFQWPLLARSFAWSRCVPDEVAKSVTSG